VSDRSCVACSFPFLFFPVGVARVHAALPSTKHTTHTHTVRHARTRSLTSHSLRPPPPLGLLPLCCPAPITQMHVCTHPPTDPPTPAPHAALSPRPISRRPATPLHSTPLHCPSPLPLPPLSPPSFFLYSPTNQSINQSILPPPTPHPHHHAMLPRLAQLSPWRSRSPAGRWRTGSPPQAAWASRRSGRCGSPRGPSGGGGACGRRAR
jgi:hypothetical protein